jgi:Tol biopolymer transport system component/DNA-binding winged helix-turn-helix (wHTH) protein
VNKPSNHSDSDSAERLIRFGPFTADLDSQELLSGKTRLKIPGQSFRILVLLLTKPGALVTREEMRQALWPADTFVDFDRGLSAAVARLREALGDSADRPKYVETLPRRGYRFIGKVEGEQMKGTDAKGLAGPLALPSPLTGDRAVTAGENVATRPGRWMLLGFVLATVASLAALVFFMVRNRTSPARLPVAVPFTSLPGIATAPAFSPDGSRIAFAWDGGNAKPGVPEFDLYVKALGGEEKLQLTHHPSEWISSAWSPDGTRIAFHRMAGNDTGIYVVSALGGPERKLMGTRIPYNVAAPVSWSPDGKWIAFGNPLPSEPRDRMFRVSVETAEVFPFEHDPDCKNEASPTFSHDGQKIFYACVHTMYDGELRSRPVTGGAPTLITLVPTGPFGIAVSSDDERVGYTYGVGLSGISIVNVKDRSVRRIDAPDDSSWPTISAQGDKLAFSTQLESVSIWRRDLLHPAVSPVNMIPSSRQQNAAQYSPDGKHIAFESKRSGAWALWVSDADGGNLLKVSNDVVGSGGPRWSPDGTKIAFDTAPTHPSSVYVVDIAEGVPRKIEADVGDMKFPAWSRDGKWIYFTSDFALGHRVFRCSPQGGRAEQLPTAVHATRPEESADGEYLYVASREVDFELGKLSLKDLKSGVRAEAIPHVLHWTLWHLTPSGIYFVPNEAPRTMRHFEFATRKIKDVFTLSKDFDAGISLSPDGRYILYSQFDEVNADILVMDKYH